ncbi:MAG: hypothetical protein EO766_16405 [Hydrotalea sp. AMD]|uniref:hypothetical protein n=1 Tax=Hydrotalea sp. AMD TaxID=2501297 RepID=UPI0010255C3B|nr:hypothetical protein [Hydrotalea sp. AMD]RWZ85645.1 MAG: hypothetical protein EO766_16405 [Hydrotalea sp. AMD]
MAGNLLLFTGDQSEMIVALTCHYLAKLLFLGFHHWRESCCFSEAKQAGKMLLLTALDHLTFSRKADPAASVNGIKWQAGTMLLLKSEAEGTGNTKK